jgi:hypothetical protein
MSIAVQEINIGLPNILGKIESWMERLASVPNKFSNKDGNIASLDIFAKYLQSGLKQEFPGYFDNPSEFYYSDLGLEGYSFTDWAHFYRLNQGYAGIHLIKGDLLPDPPSLSIIWLLLNTLNWMDIFLHLLKRTPNLILSPGCDPNRHGMAGFLLIRREE